MLAKESVRGRMESEAGISYTEFSYMLLQANDFRWLCEHEGCELQMGGSDQWGNITAGIDLIRRTLGRPAYGMTWPLLTKADGTKFGKSAEGAVWLDPTKTTPYQFRQFWVQADDAEVERYLLQFTLLDVAEVADVMARHREAPERRTAQRRLAHELTALVHGEAAADAADAAADLLFGGDPSDASPEVLDALRAEVPTTVASTGALGDLVTLLAATARRRRTATPAGRWRSAGSAPTACRRRPRTSSRWPTCSTGATSCSARVGRPTTCSIFLPSRVDAPWARR